MSVEAQSFQYCTNCKEETLHKSYEDALEVVYHCTQCQQETEIYKSFF